MEVPMNLFAKLAQRAEKNDPVRVGMIGAGKFGTNNEFQLYPVVDINDWVQTLQQGVDFRESISRLASDICCRPGINMPG